MNTYFRLAALLALTCVLMLPSLAQAKDIYALSRSKASIFTFDSASSGTVTPTRTINGAATTLTTNSVYGLAVYNGEIYVTNDSGKTINVFQMSDSGNVAPTRQITGGNTGFALPRDIIVHAGYIYCADESDKSVKVFKTSDSGDVAPTREITGFTRSPYACAIYNSELYVQDSNTKIYVFDLTASGTVAATKKRELDLSGSLSSPRGLFVADGIIYSSDFDQVDTYAATGAGAVVPITTIKGINTSFSSVHSLMVDDGNIYAGNYNNSAKAVEVFSTSANGDVAADRFFTATGIGTVIDITMETGYVSPATHQQSGVTVNVTKSVQNSTSEAVFTSTFSPPPSFAKATPLAEFEATVDSNGANGVFSFSSSALNGTAGTYSMLKCFSTNGSSIFFGGYSLTADPDTDGAWWIEDDNGNYLAGDTVLNVGTNYRVNFVVQDNGKYDEDSTLGQIKDPAVLGSLDSGTGCVFNPGAGFGLEWLMLGFGVLLSILRSLGKKK